MKLLIKSIGILLIITCMSSCGSGTKIGYVDINLLFESFDYKKQMAAEYNKVKVQRDRILDSLEFGLNVMAKSIEKEGSFGKESEQAFEAKRQEYYSQVKRFEEDNQALVVSYDEKIKKQLNAYIKEFGKKQGYQLIVGADNKGSILYGDDKLDVTKQLTEYVNQRYKGEKN